MADVDISTLGTEIKTAYDGEADTILGYAASDEDSDLSTGTAKLTFIIPYSSGFTLSGVIIEVKTAPTGSTIVVDVNEGGVSILSTKLSIDISETNSTTAAVPPVISDSDLAGYAQMTVDIDQVGSSTPGSGLKIYLIGAQK